jgi:energy-coupling factor transporter ATP-binding protein EcfA2
LNFLGESLKVAEEQAEKHLKKVLDEVGINEKLYWELREIVDID